MSKHENKEEMPDKTVVSVYIPDEDIYGTLIAQNSYYSVVEYYDNGIRYHIQIDNDDFIVVDEFGVGYVDEEYYEEESDDYL
jgi:hypothetical protein